MNGRRSFLIAPLFLMIILACAVPGISTASTPLSTPTVDRAAIETMVAGTVAAAIAQTEQSTPVPNPVSIIIVTEPPASTPAPTITPTATSTEVTKSPSQSELNKQADGSILFSDELAHYKITLPANWLPVRINEKEYLDAFSLGDAANTHVQQALLGIQNEDPNVFRLFALDIQPAHIQNDFVTDMRFVLDEEMDISLNSNEELEAIAREIPASAAAFRFEVISVKVVRSAGGIDFGVIEAQSSFASATGTDVPLHQKQVFFNVPVGTQSITLTTVGGLKETMWPAFDAMLETVILMEEEED